MRRRIGIVAITVGLLGTLSSVAAPAVFADAFDTACASPTQTISADSTATLNLVSGDVVLISGGRFSGGVNAFPAGACSASGRRGRSRRRT